MDRIGNYIISESKFNDFEPRLMSAKNRFQLSAGLNFGTLINIIKYNWNQPYLSRGSNSLNSATDILLNYQYSFNKLAATYLLRFTRKNKEN